MEILVLQHINIEDPGFIKDLMIKDVILEDWSELIELDENKNFKQVRFSPRLDYVPVLKKEELDLYYKARKKLSDLYNSDFYRIEFKLFGIFSPSSNSIVVILTPSLIIKSLIKPGSSIFMC